MKTKKWMILLVCVAIAAVGGIAFYGCGGAGPSTVQAGLP